MEISRNVSFPSVSDVTNSVNSSSCISCETSSSSKLCCSSCCSSSKVKRVSKNMKSESTTDSKMETNFVNSESDASSPKAESLETCNAGSAGDFDVKNFSPCGVSLAPSEELRQFVSEWKSLQQDDLSSADYYFNSYAHFGIHEEMLKDTVRTGAYKRAILNNKHLFEDKIVLDVGSGTGILCFFAVKAGARQVYGIECSEIVEVAKKIAKVNNLDDKVQFIKGRAEDVELPVDKVDIILSEWMGYFLLYESMLDTVILCRDKWLKKGGLIFPDKACLYIAAIEDGEYKEEKIGYWGDVYGFDFSCVQKCVMEEPIVDTVDSNAIVTTSAPILMLDLNTCSKADLNFCSKFKIQLRRKDYIHAFIAWFDIIFSCCHRPITFSTSPACRFTHWKQTVFYIDHVLVANKDEFVDGVIVVKKNQKNPRDLDIKIMYDFKGAINPVSNIQYYRLR